MESKKKETIFGIGIGVSSGLFVVSLSFVYQWWTVFLFSLALPIVLGIIFAIWFRRAKFLQESSWVKIATLIVVSLIAAIWLPVVFLSAQFHVIAAKEFPVYQNFEKGRLERHSLFSEFGLDPRGFSITFRQRKKFTASESIQKGDAKYDEVFNAIIQFSQTELSTRDWEGYIARPSSAPNVAPTICFEKPDKNISISTIHGGIPWPEDSEDYDWTMVTVQFHGQGTLSCEDRGYEKFNSVGR